MDHNLPADILPGQVAKFVQDDGWMLQEKMDGIRVFITVRENSIITTTRSGGNLHLPTSLKAELQHITPANTTLDGELMHSGVFYAFDTTMVNGTDITSVPAHMRWQVVTAMFQGCTYIKMVDTVFSTEDKLAFLQQMMDRGAEGVIWKKKDAPYVQGRSAWNGTILRQKFRKRAEVIVMKRPDDTCSLEMFVMQEDGQPHHVGGVNGATLIPGTRQSFYSQMDSCCRVAEVEYLYASGEPTMHLVQAVLVRFRDDKNPNDCTKAQLQVGPRWRA